jgi:tetratricopeptide (TPR) repeat protein
VSSRRPALAAPLAALLTLGILAAGSAGPGSAVRAQPPGPASASAPGDLPPLEVARGLRRARLAHDRGESAEELALLRAAAEAFPEEMVVTYALLEYHSHHGLPEEEHRRLRARLGERLADSGRPVAMSLIGQIALDPDTDDELLGELARYLRARLTAPARPDARVVSDEDAERLLRYLAGVQLRLDRTAEAADALARLWRRSGDTQVAWELLPLRRELGDAEGVLALIESVDEMREVLWPLWVRSLAEAGRLADARAELDSRIAALGSAGAQGQAPDEGTVFHGIVWAADRGGILASAAQDLAWIHRDFGEDAEAEALFRRALELQPDDPVARSALAELYASEEERRAAAAARDRTWEEISDPHALMNEGTQRLAAGDAEGSFDLLERAAAGLPDLEAAWYNLGMAAYGMKRWDRAAEALVRAAELNPERAASPFFAGVALSHLERCGEAVPMLERALELDPARRDAHYYLAGCLRALGRIDESERHRRLYSESAPSR